MRCSSSSPTIVQPDRRNRSCMHRYDATSWLKRPPANHSRRLGSLNSATTPARSCSSELDANVASSARVNACWLRATTSSSWVPPFVL